MSDDIVTLLRREWEYGNNAKGCDYEMFARAADEIERLRAVVVLCPKCYEAEHGEGRWEQVVRGD